MAQAFKESRGKKWRLEYWWMCLQQLKEEEVVSLGFVYVSSERNGRSLDHRWQTTKEVIVKRLAISTNESVYSEQIGLPTATDESKTLSGYVSNVLLTDNTSPSKWICVLHLRIPTVMS